MNRPITILERYILEAINLKPMGLIELAKTSDLDIHNIIRVVEHLLDRNFLFYKDTHYHLNKNLTTDQIHHLSNKASSKFEASELVSTFILSHSEFKMKKVYIDEKDERILSSMFMNIQSFLKASSKKCESIKKQKLIFWGHESYSNIINNYVESF